MRSPDRAPARLRTPSLRVNSPWIAVTGASGFIGAAFCRRAVADGRPVRRFVRERRVTTGGRARIDERPGRDPTQANVPTFAIDLPATSVDDLTRMLEGASTIVHLAGRAHVVGETAADPEAAYQIANAEATERLARAGVAAGARRFIFASTVKVNGEATAPGHPFRTGDLPAPQDAYARSKAAAEQVLRDVAEGTAMQPLIVRLPLVYGQGARGNFRRLVDAVAARRWLPLGAIDNRRSLLGLPNLLDALDAAIDAAVAPGGVHFIADAESVSTPDLVRAIARALGVAPRLVPVPVAMLTGVGAICGKSGTIARLTNSLEVDTTSFSAATGWQPRSFAIDAAAVSRAQGE